LLAQPPEADQLKSLQYPNYYLHVTLSGVVKYMVFPGPPNFVSVEEGDYEEPRWILDVDDRSLKRLVETQASATSNNYAFQYIDTTLKADESNAHLVTLDSSFTGEPDNIELYKNKMVTIDAVISAQPAHCHTPFVVEINQIISHE
jgi:hypothetical protein